MSFMPFFLSSLARSVCVFVLRSNGTLDVWGDGEGVAVRSIKSVAPDA